LTKELNSGYTNTSISAVSRPAELEEHHNHKGRGTINKILVDQN